MASRQVSVRDSAQEFQIPAAQFSVSKYQLMPHTGTVAAMIAAKGSPVCKRLIERGGDRVARCPHAGSQTSSSTGARPPRRRARQPLAPWLDLPEMPSPHAPFDPARGGARHSRYSGLTTSSVTSTAIAMSPSTATAGDTSAEDRQVGAHAAHVNREQRGDERERPAAVDRPARACSAASTSAAMATARRFIGQPELLDDGVVGLGRGCRPRATSMFQAMPAIRSAPAIATTQRSAQAPRANRSSSATRGVAEGGQRGRSLAPGAPARGTRRSRSGRRRPRTSPPRAAAAPRRRRRAR